MNRVKSGLLISVDGPSGVGKSTFIKELYNQLKLYNSVILTKEPSSSRLGVFTKENEANLYGLSYAYLVSADRCYHVETEIVPNIINSNKIVITDRYIESSIVLQGFDGVSVDKIWDLNKNFPIPNLSVLLLADEKIVEKRLADRTHLSLFEKRMTRKDEIQRYMYAKEFLSTKGFNFLTCYNNTLLDIENNISKVCHFVLSQEVIK